jgi:hypothetical protein
MIRMLLLSTAEGSAFYLGEEQERQCGAQVSGLAG